MKFKLVEDIEHLDEVYFTSKNLIKHYNKHVVSDEDGSLKMDDMSADEYNNLADKLSSSEASKINDKQANIIGYIAANGKSVKHDRLNNLTVVYVDDDIQGHEAISLYKQPSYKFYRMVNDITRSYHFKSHLQNS